jgi:hypothetical protein
VHARIPEPVTFNFVRAPALPAVSAKAKVKLPESSGYAVLQKRLKAS